MRTYVAVPGTWAWRDRNKPDAWFQPGSPFAGVCATALLIPLRQRPFLWTTRVNGNSAWRRWFSWFIPRSWERGDHLDWEACALGLLDYCEHSVGWPDVMIAHSHGGQLVAYAAARGLQIPLLITVATPVRGDMKDVWALARPNIGYWRHLHASDGDPIQWWGSFGDGDFGPARGMPLADENIAIPRVGHTKLLEDVNVMPAFRERGWLSPHAKPGIQAR